MTSDYYGYWIAISSALGIVGACVFNHYEVLTACNRYLPALSQRRRPRVMILIFILLAAHFLEIGLFAVGYLVLASHTEFGALVGLPTQGLIDFVYFSVMTYTTVGIGDVVPIGPIRLVAGIEALTGLVMITWSASFTFLEMQRDWVNRSSGQT